MQKYVWILEWLGLTHKVMVYSTRVDQFLQFDRPTVKRNTTVS